MRSKTRKELSRLQRRLSDDAPVTLTVAADRDTVGPALDAFLVLERSGWKGRRGTALAARANEAAFIRAAASVLARRGQMRVALLNREGRAIAGAIVMLGGGRAFYFKTAYDERLARFSPGALLTRELTRHLLADSAIVLTDSLAVPGHPMIDRLWPDRIEVFDWLVATGPAASGAFAAVAALETARRGLLAQLRPLAHLLHRYL